MEEFTYVNLFSTKGIEYITVIVFLISFVFFIQYLNKPAYAVKVKLPVKKILIDWFYLAKGYFYHQGHTWAIPENGNMVRVGVDDFAQKLLGKPDKVILPKLGTTIKQGENGWKFIVDQKQFDILSPISGKIVEINNKVITTPEIINNSVYENGWLIKVKPENLKSELTNLISKSLSKLWMEDTIDKLSSRMTSNFGVVLQDGGTPVSGFAKELAPETWEILVKEFLKTE